MSARAGSDTSAQDGATMNDTAAPVRRDPDGDLRAFVRISQVLAAFDPAERSREAFGRAERARQRAARWAAGEIEPVHGETAEDRAERARIAADYRARHRTMKREALVARCPKRLRKPLPYRVGRVFPQVEEWALGAGSTLILWGESVGVGKSLLAWNLALRASHEGQWVEAWSMIELNEALRPGGDPGVLDDVKGCDLLLMDELASEARSPWTTERLTEIVDARWGDERRMIVTSNTPPGDLASVYGSRIADRLRDDAVIVEMLGASHRNPRT